MTTCWTRASAQRWRRVGGAECKEEEEERARRADLDDANFLGFDFLIFLANAAALRLFFMICLSLLETASALWLPTKFCLPMCTSCLEVHALRISASKSRASKRNMGVAQAEAEGKGEGQRKEEEEEEEQGAVVAAAAPPAAPAAASEEDEENDEIAAATTVLASSAAEEEGVAAEEEGVAAEEGNEADDGCFGAGAGAGVRSMIS